MKRSKRKIAAFLIMCMVAGQVQPALAAPADGLIEQVVQENSVENKTAELASDSNAQKPETDTEINEDKVPDDDEILDDDDILDEDLWEDEELLPSERPEDAPKASMSNALLNEEILIESFEIVKPEEPGQYTLLEVGVPYQVEVKITPEDATEKLRFSGSSGIEVTDTGLVTATKPGLYTGINISGGSRSQSVRFKTTEEICSVTFDGQGGTTNGEEKLRLEIEKETTIYLPNYIPERGGYAFTGWYLDPECSDENRQENSIVPENGMTLYAGWVEGCELTFDFGIVWEGETEKRITVAPGEPLGWDVGRRIPSFPANPYETGGKLFKGWKNSEGKIVTDFYNYNPKGDELFTAVWIDDYYVITFDFNGGISEYGQPTLDQYVVPGNVLSGVYVPNEFDGKVFGGWSTEDETLLTSNDLYYYIPNGNETLTAVWSEYYIVSYDPAGGTWGGNSSEIRTEKVAIGNAIRLSSVGWPTKEGYVFGGWYVEGTGELAEDNQYKPTSDVTLVAQWSSFWTVKYDLNGGKPNNSYTKLEAQVIQGQSLNLMSSYNVSKDGFTLVGWCENQDGTGETLTGSYIPTKDVTLYAMWEKYYTVTLDAGKGVFYDGKHSRDEVVVAGEAIGYLQNPSAADAAFGGWYQDPECTKPANRTYIPEADVTLYAKWIEETYVIRIHADGPYYSDPFTGGKVSEAEIKIAKGGSVGSISANRDGYEDLWYLDPEFKTPLAYGYVPEKDIDVYVKWVRSLRINWDADGGRNSSGYASGYMLVAEGEYGLLPDVYKNGYVFDGWYTLDGMKVDRQSIFYENTSVKARWIEGYEVTLDLNGGILSERDTERYLPDFCVGAGEEIGARLIPSRDGYMFDGWKSNVDGTVYTSLNKVTVKQDTVFTAQWKKGMYRLTFHANGRVMYTDGVDWEEKEYMVPAGVLAYPYLFGDRFSIDGWTNIGWAETPDAEEALDLTTYEFQRDTDLYAVWKESWTVVLVLNGGVYGKYSNDISYSTYVARGEALTVPNSSDMKREGYIFGGWYRNPELTGDPVELLGYVMQGHEIFYAKWLPGEAKMHTVSFDTNGGSEIPQQQVRRGDMLSIPETPKKSGAIFKNWYTDKNCTMLYDFSRPVSSDMTLYAGWMETVDLKDAQVNVTGSYTYTGESIIPIVEVYMGTAKLTEDVDYTVQAENNINAGEASVTVTAMGDIYTGSQTVSFRIEQAESDVEIPTGPFTAVYGDQLKDVKPELPSGWSWERGEEMSCGDVGEHTETILYPPTEDGNYKGKTAEITITVAPKSLEQAQIKVLTKENDLVYNDGQAIEPEVSVTLGGAVLSGDHYDVSYENNYNAGEAWVVVTGKGNYAGEVRISFTIQPADPGLIIGNQVYEARYGDKLSSVELPEGWSWQNPAASVGAVTGTGYRQFKADFDNSQYPNYESKTDVELKVKVLPRLLKGTEEILVQLEQNLFIYTGAAITPAVTVTDHGLGTEAPVTLQENVDYTLNYVDNVDISAETERGYAYAEIAGKGNYEGTRTAAFEIISDPYDLSGAKVSVSPQKADYTGEEIRPTVTVEAAEITEEGVLQKKNLTEGVEFDLEYRNNIEPGIAFVTVSGTGEKGNGYYGTQTKTFVIRPADYDLRAVYSDYLREVELPAGWSWQIPDEFVGDVTPADEPRLFAADHEGMDSEEFRVHVAPKNIAHATVEMQIEGSLVYEEGGVKAKIRLHDTKTGADLEEGVDYQLTYENYENAGEAVVTITGIGNYTGIRNTGYEIEKAEPELKPESDRIQNDKMDLTIKDEPFFLYTSFRGDGEISYSSENESVFTVEKKENEFGEPNDGYLTVTGIGESKLTIHVAATQNYREATLVYDVMVSPADIANADVRLAQSAYPYTGSQIKPEVTVEGYGETLTEDQDYEVVYGANINAGKSAGSVTVRGIGDYTGSATVSFDIDKSENPAEAPELSFEAIYGQKLSEFELEGGWQWAEPEFRLDRLGQVIAKIVLPETDNYLKKEAECTFEVEARELTADMLELEYESTVYDGTEKRPAVQVMEGSLLTAEDYEVSWKNHVNAGTASVLVTAKNHFKGEAELQFVIEKAEPELRLAVESRLEKRTGTAPFNLGAELSVEGVLVYTSNNTDAADVDESGLVTVKNPGMAVLAVRYAGDENHEAAEALVELTVLRRSSGGSGGSSSSGGSGGSGSVGGNSAGPGAASGLPMGYTGETKQLRGITVPVDVVDGSWTQNESGTWNFTDDQGKPYQDAWVHIFNPYVDQNSGQLSYSWFRFDETGAMMTGWMTDAQGNSFYLNPDSDGTKGAMVVGWRLIDGKWYYFNEMSDGSRGRMFKNEKTPEGYYVDENGVWDEQTAK